METLSNTSFKSLGLDAWLVKNLEAVGITKPTQIQQDTLVPALASKHLVGCAQTGSGKTACFALPILQKLARDPFGVFALVLSPTRELCFQIRDQINSFAGVNLNLRTAVLVGGVDFMKQAKELQEIPHVVVACPGRLLHFLENDQY